MNYSWNWGVFLDPVSTGEPATYLGWLLSGFNVTIQVSLTAWVIALIFGTFLGVLRTLPGHGWSNTGAAYVSIFRNIPLIVQFFIWYFVIPELLPQNLGTWIKQLPPTTQFYVTSVVCLGLFTAARICEQVRSGLLSLPPRQSAACLALGFSRWQAYRYVLLPVAFRVILPPLTSEFLNVFKNSAVASTIGLLELTAQARQLVDYTAHTYESFIAVTLAYAVINLFVVAGARIIEPRLRIPGSMGGQ
ncbi:amino acid ABC transporter permease [Rhizobium leguminosarum]|uniref:amino acid ABC transporter permease n=1 Tax=Rhizobium leguminosarum TaxID=384 RepID=UPI001C95929F|nr:amino acid ABC transporter permease [Rhizobium leguminosarum]MBY5502436.1 amino acid ABC transporter permease [Rhizobium leguminosarum]